MFGASSPAAQTKQLVLSQKRANTSSPISPMSNVCLAACFLACSSLSCFCWLSSLSRTAQDLWFCQRSPAWFSWIAWCAGSAELAAQRGHAARCSPKGLEHRGRGCVVVESNPLIGWFGWFPPLFVGFVSFLNQRIYFVTNNNTMFVSFSFRNPKGTISALVGWHES